MPHLHIVDPEGHECDVPLVADEYVIGRDPSVSIPLSGAAAAAKVSRRHARLFRRGKRWLVEDLGSANGVYLDGARITEARLLLPESDLEISGFLFKLVDAPEPKVTLSALEGPFAGRVFTLGPGEHDVGRADAPIELADPSVSRRHATVIIEPGRVLVKDHMSSNGTFKNDERISVSEVADGDVLTFGSIALRVSLRAAGTSSRFAMRPDLIPWRAVGLAASSVTLATALAAITYFSVLALRQHHSTALDDYEAGLLNDLVGGHALAQQGRWEDAQAAFRAVLAKDPLNREARAALAASEAQANAQAENQRNEQAAVETLSSRYSQEEVRQAVLRYAAGDVESAEKALRLLPEAVAGKVLRDIQAVRERRSEALRAEQKGQRQQALLAWGQALALDALILPASYPSAVRDEAEKQRALLQSRTEN